LVSILLKTIHHLLKNKFK